MEPKNTIKQWAKDDRPREKLLAIGSNNLSNSELLAILIHNGTPKKSALDLAKEILKLGNDNLNELGKLTIKDLTNIKGIGEAKAVTVAAALELGRRRQDGSIPEKEFCRTSDDIANFLRERLKDYAHEVFAAIYLNQAARIISFDIISQGGITATIADPRIILKKALEKNAVSIIISHNHPSGNLTPSKADEKLTQKMKEAASYLDIKLLDHIIVSESGHFSFANSGLLD
ncbi:MAG TPA: DNA repair protein RadC [Niabella sp.]|nr:DNA repair protein RadC [Niabella sp.]HQW14680.1 DNA repair protein RadC [Niabella sp.]HQX19819.1 DNA repair protein RadC [Niabella sp.]HQX42284.1 DNA repair protein RadC [Niabella sp.]HRB08337.1 DNA repair protein RadC [Niabella sp.]